MTDVPHALVDLRQLSISQYDYDNKNADDDFLPLAEKMTHTNVIILATPVYWYSVSGQMKRFIYRFSDLITIRKDLGRALKDRHLYVIACGAGPRMPDYFDAPLADTARYFDMHYGGSFYYYSGDDPEFTEGQDVHAQEFAKRLAEANMGE